MLVACLESMIHDRAFWVSSQEEENQQQAFMESVKSSGDDQENVEQEQQKERASRLLLSSSTENFRILYNTMKEQDFQNHSTVLLEKSSSDSSICSNDETEEETGDSASFSSDYFLPYVTTNTATTPILSSKRTTAMLPSPCLLPVSARKRVYFQDGPFPSVEASHNLEPHEVEQMWYSKSELKEIRREMLLVNAQTVLSSSSNPHALGWWTTLFYFHNFSASPNPKEDEKLLPVMRVKLLMAYVQAEELVGLERILLSLLHDRYAGPRSSLLKWIQEQKDVVATLTDGDIASYQAKVSGAFCIFAHELAMAQADALQLQNGTV